MERGGRARKEIEKSDEGCTRKDGREQEGRAAGVRAKRKTRDRICKILSDQHGNIWTLCSGYASHVGTLTLHLMSGTAV